MLEGGMFETEASLCVAHTKFLLSFGITGGTIFETLNVLCLNLSSVR